MNPFFRINCAMALGIFGGSLALWRHRQIEKARPT